MSQERPVGIAPQRQRTPKEMAVICITLFPASTFLGNKKKSNFILTCLTKINEWLNEWLVFLYAHVTGVVMQGLEGRRCPTRQRPECERQVVNRTLVLSLREMVKVLETEAFILCCCAHVEAW